MSSVASIQPFVDKENAGAHPKNMNSSRTGLGGKLFQNNSLSTPRSVLKDRNQGLSARPQQELGLKPLKSSNVPVFKEPSALSCHPAPSHKKDLKLHNESEKRQKQVVTVQPDTKHVTKAEALPPKENMHIYNNAEEKKSRMEIDLRGVVDMFRQWRPTCWLSSREEGESDTEVDLSDLEMPPLEAEPEPQISAEDLLDHIPYMDEDIPIPFVDDSLDIEPNMGTLEIWDERWLSISPEKNDNSLSCSPDKHESSTSSSLENIHEHLV